MWLWNQADLCSNLTQLLISCAILGKVLQFSDLHICKLMRVNIMSGTAVSIRGRTHTMYWVLDLAHIRNLINRVLWLMQALKTGLYILLFECKEQKVILRTHFFFIVPTLLSGTYLFLKFVCTKKVLGSTCLWFVHTCVSRCCVVRGLRQVPPPRPWLPWPVETEDSFASDLDKLPHWVQNRRLV